jgi:branched-chain amino acid transport system permease protein
MINLSIPVLEKAIMSALVLSGTYTLLSVGLTLIAGVLNVINFAHGALLMMAMYTIFWLFTLLNIHPFFSLIGTIPLFFVVGMAVQKCLISPLKTVENQVLVTFAFAIILENLALILWSADYRSMITPFSEISIQIHYVRVSLVRVLMIIVGLFLTFLVHLFITRTKLGKGVWALAQDPEATMLMGINVNMLRLLTFGLGTALLAVTGTFLAQVFYIYPGFGFRFVIICFIIVVLGGFGSIGGAVLASFVIGFTEVFSTIFIGSGYAEMVIYLIFILLLVFRPSGLFGKIRT